MTECRISLSFSRGEFSWTTLDGFFYLQKQPPAQEKNLCWILLFNKVEGLQVCNCIKKRFQHRCFPLNIAKFLKTPILKNICEPPVFTCLTRFTSMFLFLYPLGNTRTLWVLWWFVGVWKRNICLKMGFTTVIEIAQKMKFSIKDFFSKWDQIRWKLRNWSHLLKKS